MKFGAPMIDRWGDIQATLVQIFSESTGIPFAWDNSSRRSPRPPIGLLSLEQSAVVGRDSHQHTFRDSEVAIDIHGQRELIINVQLRSKLSKNSPSSRELAEKARLSLANPNYREKLNLAGLVFVETHPLVNIDFSKTARRELRTSFDIVFRTFVYQQIYSPQTKFFDSILVSGDINEY